MSRGVAAALWVLTEIAILGADIQAVIGSAVALKLLLGFPIWLGVLLTLVDCFTLLWINADRTQQLESGFAACIAVMAVAFLYTSFLSRPSLPHIIQGLLLPTLPTSGKDAVDLLSLLGCILMPHNVFLHSALVLTRDVRHQHPAAVAEANYYFSLETALALLISLILNCSVVCAFASPLISTTTGKPFTFETAPTALETAFGKSAVYIWATGLLAAGQNAAIAGTYAGQYVMQGLLNLKFSRPVRLLVTRLVTIIPLAALACVGQEVVDSVCRIINMSQAFLLPFTLIPLVGFSSSPQVMGVFRLCGWRLYTAWLLAGAITVGSAVVAFTQLDALHPSPQLWVVFLVLVTFYALLLVALWRQRQPPLSCAYLLAQQRAAERGAGDDIREEALALVIRRSSRCQTLLANPQATASSDCTSHTLFTQVPSVYSSTSSSSSASVDAVFPADQAPRRSQEALSEDINDGALVADTEEESDVMLMPKKLVDIPH